MLNLNTPQNRNMALRIIITTLAVLGSAVANPFSVRRSAGAGNFLGRRDYSSTLSSAGLAKLQSLGFGSVSGVPANGVNAVSGSNAGVWIGNDGSYTVTYTNTSPNEVVLVVWGDQPQYMASFVMSVQPLITISLPGNSGSTTLSFADDQSGAWAGVYSGTEMTANGQISNTWGEFTMSPSGVVDVSREVYADGNSMSIAGPDCTTNMGTCVFECTASGATTCGASGTYTLTNCAIGSQPGAQTNDANTSGGCGWLGATSVSLQATFS